MLYVPVLNTNKNMILDLELILKQIIDSNINSNALYKYSSNYIKKIIYKLKFINLGFLQIPVINGI